VNTKRKRSSEKRYHIFAVVVNVCYVVVYQPLAFVTDYEPIVIATESSMVYVFILELRAGGGGGS